MELAWNKYAFVDLLFITENANHPIHFPIFNHIFVCGVFMVFRVQLLLSYVDLQYWICTNQDNETLTSVLTICGSNSYQDFKAKSLELKKVG